MREFLGQAEDQLLVVDPYIGVGTLLANCALCYAHEGNIGPAEQLLHQAEDEHEAGTDFGEG